MSDSKATSVFAKYKKDLKYDLPASLVVFLVALPLCLGIAMASGAPLFSGLLTGVIGGILVAAISGSHMSVSGPAAGLTVVVLGAIETLNAYNVFLLAVVLAGAIQLVLGIIKAGMIGNYFPSSVIIGMLAAIGITIILTQIPHAVGYDETTEFGEEDYTQIDADQTFGAIQQGLRNVNFGAAVICVLSLLTLIYWPKIKRLNLMPAPLVVVAIGIGLHYAFDGTRFELGDGHTVLIPEVDSFGEFMGLFTLPDFTAILNKDVWIIAFTIAIIASLETLLSIEAVDKIDPFKRVSPTNRELVAQGIGNMSSGILGGLPMTSVIVRSSANVNAGGRTRMSSMFHGLWLLVAVLFIPGVINLIPLSCLAAILLHTGYKLANPQVFRDMWRKGKDQFVPFIVTIGAVLVTDLLVGVGIGLIVGVFYILRNNMSNTFEYELNEYEDGAKITIRLAEEVSFLNKAPIQKSLYSLPLQIDKIVIDGSRSRFIDKDVIEVLKDFEQFANNRGIAVKMIDIVNEKNIPSINQFNQAIKDEKIIKKEIRKEIREKVKDQEDERKSQ